MSGEKGVEKIATEGPEAKKKKRKVRKERKRRKGEKRNSRGPCGLQTDGPHMPRLRQ